MTSELLAGISVVVPVYNSQPTLTELVDRLNAVLMPLAEPYEIILVNDASQDSSWEQICQLVERLPQVRGINLSRNSGQHPALLCGVRQARYQVIVTLDDDLQNPPEEIPMMLAELRRGYDVVYGVPVQQTHGWWRDSLSAAIKWVMVQAMGTPHARSISAFRVFRTELRQAFADYCGPTVNLDVLLAWGTTRFAAVTVRQDSRRYGQSGYTLRKLVRHAVVMMTGFSTTPLRLATLTGFVTTGIGVILLAWVILRVLVEGVSVPGFATLASSIAIFSGVQLMALGIFGEYLAQIHARTLNKPAYTIRQLYQQQQDQPQAEALRRVG